MFSCVLSCEEDTALSIIDPTSALVELNNARRQKGRKNAGLLDFAEEQLPSLEVSLGQFFYSLQVGERRILQCDYSNRGTWKKIIQSQRFLKTKDSQLFCKWANNIHKFEGRFLGGQVSSNAFKVFNGCVVEPSILLIH